MKKKPNKNLSPYKEMGLTGHCVSRQIKAPRKRASKRDDLPSYSDIRRAKLRDMSDDYSPWY